MRRSLPVLALLATVAVLVAPPRPPRSGAPARAQLVVLATRGERSEALEIEVSLRGAGRITVAPARSFAGGAQIAHAPDGMVRGALAGDELLLVAEEDRGRDRSFAGALWRLGPRGVERVLDSLAYASRPLVVGRRVYLQRGRAGVEPRDGRIRVDELTITELDLDTGARREVAQLVGQLAFPIGLDPAAGLIAYLVGPPSSVGDGGRLVAIDLSTRATRDLGMIGTARDLSLAAPLRSGNGVRGSAIVYEGREAATRIVAALGLDGRREVLMRGARAPLAPALFPDGSVHTSAPDSRGAIDIVRAIDATTGLVVSQRYLPGRAEPELVVQHLERGQLGVAVSVPTPPGARLEPVGFAELP